MRRVTRPSKKLTAAIGTVVLLSAAIAFVLPEWIFPTQRVLSDAEYRTLFPYRSRYADLESGARIHYVDEGQGPTLLLLHGNPASAFLYRHLISELRGDFRVIAADYPGFGKSKAPAGYGYSAREQAQKMVEFFDHLRLDRAVLMVQDWGGPIGFHLAKARSDRVRGFVIGNTWAWPLAGLRRYELFSTIMGGPIGRGITQAHLGVIHVFLRRGVVKPLAENAYAAYFQPFINGDSTPVTTFPRELIGATPFLEVVEKGLMQLRDKEALIVWGEKDFAFGPDFRKRFETTLSPMALT